MMITFLVVCEIARIYSGSTHWLDSSIITASAYNSESLVSPAVEQVQIMKLDDLII